MVEFHKQTPTMAEPTSFIIRDWPGAGSGAKSDAYSNKIFDRHEKQYNVFVSHDEIQPFTNTEGGIVVAEIFSGQRIVLFQGSWLSNFQPAIFRDGNGVTFTSTEQAFQAIKVLFVAKQASAKSWTTAADAAIDLYHKIMKSTNPLYQKLSASAKYLPMDQNTLDSWARLSTEVMLQINRLKFAQNPHLTARLLELRADRFCEALTDDSTWGIGMSAQTAVRGAALDAASDTSAASSDWKGLRNMTRDEIDATTFAGQNRLGRVLQHVRAELLAGRELPRDGSDDAAREEVAELFRRTVPAADEAGPAKEAFRKRVASFAALGPIPGLAEPPPSRIDSKKRSCPDDA